MDLIDLLDVVGDDWDENFEDDLPIPRKTLPRVDPFVHYDDRSFKLRYRFGKATVRQLIELVTPDLQKQTKRNFSLTVTEQVCFFLHFNSFFRQFGYVSFPPFFSLLSCFVSLYSPKHLLNFR